jgi:hypothetical protein
MIRIALFLAASVALASAAWGQAVNPQCTVAMICPHVDKHLRHVTSRTTAAVWRASGLRRHDGICATGCKVDHIVPIEVCGSNAAANLQVQTKAAAVLKDRRENRAHREVCKGGLDLKAAQAEFRKD